MDIKKLSLDELNNLLSLIPDEIARRKTTEKQKLIEELAGLASARGFTLDELIGKRVKQAGEKKATRKPAPIKYRHPQQQELAWSGRGRQPKWVVEWLAKGKKLEELAA